MPVSSSSCCSRKPRCRRCVLLVGALFVAIAPLVGATFPVRPSDNARCLVSADGKPFPILGRASWAMASLSSEDLETYLADCLKRGYTALEISFIYHDPRENHAPFDALHRLPFLRRLDGKAWDGSLKFQSIETESPDFTTPDEDYWKGIDALLARCEKSGILVFAFPAYVGWAGYTDQGWMKEMVANGPEKMRAYGEFIARRYRDQPNLVWMLGGDFGEFDAKQGAAEQAFIDGLLKGAPGGTLKLRSAEWTSETIGTDQPQFGRYITLNGAYSFDGYTAYHTRRAYAHTPVRPAFLLEEPYDEEFTDGTNVNKHASQPVRRFQWWGFLGSIGGYISGNGYVWPFEGDLWKQHLDTQGARDMARLNAFIKSIAWETLVPSGLGGQRVLITRGGSDERAPDYVAAAASLDGRLLVVYCPPDRWGPFDVDLAAMCGPARVRWFDPTTGAYKDGPANLPNSGPRTFDIPGKNSNGELDWVLVIDAKPEVEQ